MSEDLVRLIAENKPLPERDLEEIPAGPLDAPAGCKLASYLDLSRALGRIPGSASIPLDDLFPAPPPSARFSLALAEATQDASSAGAIPVSSWLEALWRGEAAQSRRSAALAAVDRAAGVRDQFQPVLKIRPDPALLSSASDLGENLALFVEMDGTLHAGATARLGFDYTWLREIAGGVMRGDLGLQVDGALEAALDLSLAGSFLACITLDRERWLRLRIYKRNESNLDFALRLVAEAQARTPLPQDPEQLTLAILGVHDGQWLQALAGMAGSKITALEARFGAAFGRFLGLWRSLPERTAHAIWSAAASREQLAGLRDWIHQIATELRDPVLFNSALERALEANPHFASSPAGLWLEAASGGLLSAVSGGESFQQLLRAAESADSILSEPALADTLNRLRSYALDSLSLGRIRQALDSLASFGSLDAWVKQQLQVLLGEIKDSGGLGRAVQRLEAVIGLTRAIYAKALDALGQRYSAELSYQFQRTDASAALLDCSFSFSPAGLAVFRAALAGDLSFLASEGSDGSHLRLHRAALTHGLSRQARIELRLPFLARKQWDERWEALARVEIEAGANGRILAYTAEASSSLEKKGESQSQFALAAALLAGRETRFTLAYGDQRTLPAAHARTMLAGPLAAYGFGGRADVWLASAPEPTVEASLTLAIPGGLAAAWLSAPSERDPNFFEVYSAVSAAVQRALRRWLPYVYFSDLDRYDDLGAAFPLLVYQSMRPFPGEPRSEFTYDVMSPETPSLAVRSAARPLAAELARIHSLLTAAGKKSLARFYAPNQAAAISASVQRQPRLLNALLSADAFFVDALVHLGVKGRALSQELPNDPRKAVKDLAKFSEDFAATFHRRLRRLYGGQAFVAFGSLLLVEATRALGAAQSECAPIAAALHLRSGALERIFVNDAFRP